jgi:hypothetical membrane protein
MIRAVAIGNPDISVNRKTPRMHQTTSCLCRVSAISGIAAPVVLALTAGILGAIQPDYDPVTQLISELGETGAPYAGIMNVGFGLTGLLMILFSYSVYALIGKSLPGVAGSGLVLVSGVSFIAMAFFSCDAGCLPVTRSGQIHLQLGFLASIAAIAASFLLGYSMRQERTWNWYWQYSIITGALVLLLLPLFVLFSGPDGLLQRVMVGIIFLWIEILAIRFFFACNEPENFED